MVQWWCCSTLTNYYTPNCLLFRADSFFNSNVLTSQWVASATMIPRSRQCSKLALVDCPRDSHCFSPTYLTMDCNRLPLTGLNASVYTGLNDQKLSVHGYGMDGNLWMHLFHENRSAVLIYKGYNNCQTKCVKVINQSYWEAMNYEMRQGQSGKIKPMNISNFMDIPVLVFYDTGINAGAAQVSEREYQSNEM